MRRLMLRHIYVTCYLLRSLRAVVNILTDLGPFPLFFKKKIRFSASRNSVAHMNLKDSQSSLTCLRSFVNFFYRGLKDICNRYKFVINSSSQGVKDFVRWIGSILWCFPHKYFGMLLAGNPLMSNDDSGTSALPQSLISSCITAMLQPSLSIWRVQSEYHLMIDTQYSVNWTRIHFSLSRNYISKLVSSSVGLKLSFQQKYTSKKYM